MKKRDPEKKVTTTVLNTKICEVDKEIPDNSSSVTTLVLNTIISKSENKIPDQAKYITDLEFKTLTTENFPARLKQANLVNKNNFDNKLLSFKRKTTSNKTKYVEVQRKLNSLITENYNFFLGRMYLKVMMGFKTRLII